MQTLRRTWTWAASAVVLLWLGIAFLPGVARGEAGTLVFINGKPNIVFFNDGDSFRVESGPFAGTKARLDGFNTLETFGPAHQWADWHPYELLVNAKQATLNGRRGVWHCFTDEERDGYGRMLIHCPDLIISQVSQGLAHVYTVEDAPSKPEYVRAQQEAQREGRGMWAKGIPEYIMTSTHSASEGMGEKTYNRLISTRDGHTEKWKHQDTYSECQWVCAADHNYDEEALDAAAQRLREHATLGPLLAQWYNFHLREFVARYLRKGELPEYVNAEAKEPLTRWLKKEKAAGRLGSIERVKGSCMIFAEFERRYGSGRASCVRGKGNWDEK